MELISIRKSQLVVVTLLNAILLILTLIWWLKPTTQHHDGATFERYIGSGEIGLIIGNDKDLPALFDSSLQPVDACGQSLGSTLPVHCTEGLGGVPNLSAINILRFPAGDIVVRTESGTVFRASGAKKRPPPPPTPPPPPPPWLVVVVGIQAVIQLITSLALQGRPGTQTI